MASYSNKVINGLSDSILENNEDELFKISSNNQDNTENIGFENYSYWHSTWKVFTKRKGAVIMLWIVVITLIFTFIQPILPNQKDPGKIHINEETGVQDRNVQPNREFWFGTNVIGQDLWSRIWSGARTSLIIGISVGILEAIIGIIIGAIWGYVKSLDRIITEIYSILDNIPTTILLVLATYIMEPGMFTMIFVMTITGWPSMARFIRNQIVIIRDREYNLASRCLGTPTGRIIFKNLLPYLVSVIVLRIALSIPAAIGNEVFLTYIGLGLPTNISSLGNLITEGRAVMMSPSLRYQLVFPSIVLSIITISFYVMGNAFADSADPKNHM